MPPTQVTPSSMLLICQLVLLRHSGWLNLSYEMSMLQFQLAEGLLVFRPQIWLSQHHIPPGRIEIFLQLGQSLPPWLWIDQFAAAARYPPSMTGS